MKVKDIAKHMRGYGPTIMRIRVYECDYDDFRLIYEGRPYEVSEEIADRKVRGFIAKGVNLLEIDV